MRLMLPPLMVVAIAPPHAAALPRSTGVSDRLVTTAPGRAEDELRCARHDVLGNRAPIVSASPIAKNVAGSLPVRLRYAAISASMPGSSERPKR